MDKSMHLNTEEIGTGVPVLLVHGYPLDHTIWLPLVPFLKDQARLILPDLRGFGRSPIPDGPSSMRIYAEDLLRMMDGLRIEKVVIGGHSMGGYVCLAFAHHYLDRLAGLALVSSQSFPDTDERRKSRIATAEEVAQQGVKKVAQNMAPRLTSQPKLIKTLETLISHTNPAGVIGALKGMADREDATPWLSSIHIPALVIYGEKDTLISPDLSKAAVTHLTNGWAVEIPGAMHMPMMEAPGLTADALLQLIKKVKINKS
jgi:3-oxoadipate enol-lactonase